MKIRPEQMAAFDDVAERALVQRIAERLRAFHGGVVVRLPYLTASIEKLPDATTESLVRRGLRWAGRYRLSGDRALQFFVLLLFIHSPGFHVHPLVSAVLNNDTIPPQDRIDVLWEQVPAQTWREIERDYDPAMWKIGSGVDAHA